MTQAENQEQKRARYVSAVVVDEVLPSFPAGTGRVIVVTAPDGRTERQRHFKSLVEELQAQSGLLAEHWPGTEWEYDFFNHRLVKFLKGPK